MIFLNHTFFSFQLDLPNAISHLDPMIFLKLIPDNRSHKKGQGKKAMLKQIMLEYAQKEGGNGRSLPSKPQCTQQQLMSPGGTTVIGGESSSPGEKMGGKNEEKRRSGKLPPLAL